MILWISHVEKQNIFYEIRLGICLSVFHENDNVF